MTQVARFGHENLAKTSSSLQSCSPPINPTRDEVDYSDYRFEDARLGSYITWRVPSVDYRKLAAAGFYYTGTGDSVTCFECRTDLCHWGESDDPWSEHKRWSEKCRFIRGIPCGNVPVGVDPSTVPAPKSVDVCGLYGLKYMKNSGPDRNPQFEAYTVENKENYKLAYPKAYANLEVKVFDGDSSTCNVVKLCDLKDSKHPEYVSYDRRLSSYKTWPTEKIQKKEDLAAAGFFYTGHSDQTMCFFCGGGLTDWEPTDVPIEEHIKWFSECRFIKQLQAKKEEKEGSKDASSCASSAIEHADKKPM